MSTTTSSNIAETDKNQESNITKSQVRILPFPLKKPNKLSKPNELIMSNNEQEQEQEQELKQLIRANQHNNYKNKMPNQLLNNPQSDSMNKEKIIDNLANMFTEIFERLSALEQKQKNK